uniref:chloroplast envelope membrane protein n=1 Tax=Moerckia flotoviana TaxID=71401 RepID=UPI0025794917|nr:chloroplast envelope membrane protein [Moerckia flotoviana]WIA67308.1 chloroplast envelope membrane protein [Moerckia flotoviana]
MKNSHYWRIFPYCCLEKAYKASKSIQKIKKDFFLYGDMLSRSKRFSRSIAFYTDTESSHSVFVIYTNLSKYRIGLYLMKLFHLLRFTIPNQFQKFLCLEGIEKREYHGKDFITDWVFADASGSVKEINRRLAWIKATLDDLYIWKRYYLFHSPSYINKKGEAEYFLPKARESGSAAIAYESIGLLPRSITRTSSRFRAELIDQSDSLVLWEFRLAKYQALASLQYIACLIFIPLAISISFRKCFLESQINHWWNSHQSQIFVASFQEEEALDKLQKIEELFWLEKVVSNTSFGFESQDFSNEIHRQTIELVRDCNNDSIETILHLLTDVVYFITLSGLFILGKERLIILNAWAQELFYSLSDTMKAFFILLLTDLCIGFHSPHGWEIAISSCSEHLGFIRDKHVISCFVSTFPVIPDTVFKYLIFRHLNRISPSIVATYHTMNE